MEKQYFQVGKNSYFKLIEIKMKLYFSKNYKVEVNIFFNYNLTKQVNFY